MTRSHEHYEQLDFFPSDIQSEQIAAAPPQAVVIEFRDPYSTQRAREERAAIRSTATFVAPGLEAAMEAAEKRFRDTAPGGVRSNASPVKADSVVDTEAVDTEAVESETQVSTSESPADREKREKIEALMARTLRVAAKRSSRRTSHQRTIN